MKLSYSYKCIIWLLFALLSCNRFTDETGDDLFHARLVEDISRIPLTAFCEDNDGAMWMASQANGIFRYDGRFFFQYIPGNDSLSLSSKYVNCLLKDASGRLWAGTQKGIDLYNPEADCFVRYGIDEGNRYIVDLTTDAAGNVYAVTKRNLLKLDEREHAFHSVIEFPAQESIETRAVFHSGGVNIVFDQVVERYDNSFTHTGTFPRTDILPIPDYTDSHKNVWRPLPNGGFHISRSNPFAHTAHGALLTALEGHSIGEMFRTADWEMVVTDNRNLLIYHIDRKEIAATVDLTGLTGETPTDAFHLSAWKEGILISNGIHAFPCRILQDGKISVQGRYSLDNPAQRTVFLSDTDGHLWAAGVGSAIYHSEREPVKGSDIRMEPVFQIGEDTFVNASCFLHLKDGSFLIGFSDIGPVHFNPATSSFRIIKLPLETPQVYIRGMFEARDGMVWIYTSDEGLFCLDRKTGSIAAEPAFKHADVTNVAEDASGTLYCISDNTLFVRTPGDGSFIQVWTGTTNRDAAEALFPLPDGQLELYTGNSFRSVNILSGRAKEALDVSLDVFLSNDNEVFLRTDPHLIKARPANLSLASDNRNLTLHFPVIEPEGKNLYNYSFAFGKGPWQHAQSNPSLPLYNLNWGRNAIRLKAVDASSLAESLPVTIIFTIRRPWYHYAMMVSGAMVFFLILLLLRSRRLKKKAAEKAEQETRFQEAINRNNIDFFSNVSHEFRTPLSLIEGAVSTLSEDKRLSPQQEQLTGIIRRNSGRMLRLVDQMLDFNRLDHDMLALQVSLKDVSRIFLEVSQAFEVGAGLKQIDWRVEGCDNPCLMWVDSDKLEKILYNLCSNAMKHTPQGGSITLRLGQTDRSGQQFARFTVEDSGPGIPPDKRQFIFERFAQLPSGKRVGGTGIGLSYCKSLAELHHGSMEAGGDKGAVFQLLLPMERQAYSPSEVLLDPTPEKAVSSAMDYIPKVGEAIEGRPNVLVIDDDYEFVYYLQALLGSQFNVSFRFDAESGFEALEASPADLVISDVMMPGTDGMQLCRKIKETLSLCHIPVILLTAKASLENQIEGLGTGADAYIPKPFDKDYLLVMCRTLLENRKRIQQQLDSAGTAGASQADGMVPLDREFLQQLYTIMERSLDEGEMNVDQVAEQLHIGRSKFYYKVKALTGKTPNEFFTAYKLNRSLELLKSGKYKIAAVAAMVGFNSPSHFTTIFKKHFGYPPSQV